MSERMTSEAVTRAVAAVLDDVIHQGAVDAVQALGVECSRAHASEEAKDATIKALADALEGTAPRNVDGPCWCRPGLKARGNDGDHERKCQERRTTLRLCGRLP